MNDRDIPQLPASSVQTVQRDDEADGAEQRVIATLKRENEVLSLSLSELHARFRADLDRYESELRSLRESRKRESAMPVAPAGNAKADASGREPELMLEIRRLRIRHAGATAENNALRENVRFKDSRIRELEAALRDSVPAGEFHAARMQDSSRIGELEAALRDSVPAAEFRAARMRDGGRIRHLEIALRSLRKRHQALPWRALRFYYRLRKFVPRRLLFAVNRMFPSHPL